jgi:hypothetical protein
MRPSGPPTTRYRSPDFNPRLNILTDFQITRYILAGRYGTAARERLIDSQQRKAKTTPGNRKKRNSPASSMSLALRLLNITTS